MARGPNLSPEAQAYFALFAIGLAVVLLADLALLWVIVVGRAREKPLLARRWSAAHVLVAFQAWLLITAGFALAAGIVLAIAELVTGSGARVEQRWMSPILIATLIVQNIAMAAAVLYTVLVLYDQRPVAAGLSLRNWAPKVTLGLLAAVLVIPLSLGLEQLSTQALRHVAYTTLIQRAFRENMDEVMGLFRGPGGLALEILLVGIIAPCGEELFFRGFAYRCFCTRWGPAAGMLVSAALFSLIHLNPDGLLPIFVVGCALAYLYERTGTLVAPFTLHAANNIAAVLAAYFAHGR
jgi:membrane protease YdiL (CAAX protease family)